MNGTIFVEDVFKKEIQNLRELLESPTNLVYLAGVQWEKGIGKSALVVHEWRRLKAKFPVDIYVRCTADQPNNTPGGICASIVAEIHRQGCLWKALESHLLAYAKMRGGARLTPSSVQTLFNTVTEPPSTVPLTLYTHITDPKSLEKDFAAWLAQEFGIGEEASKLFASSYLTHPSELPDEFSKRSKDRIKLYEGILKITSSAGLGHHYIFLDQLEDTIMSTPSSKIGDFSLGMRRILEASVGTASYVVTLHPDSETKLRTKAADHLMGLAPIDKAHAVDVMALEEKSELVVPLATEFLQHFRTGTPPSPEYPFTPEALRYFCFVEEGLLREILQKLHYSIKSGAVNGCPQLDLQYITAHHSATLGRELDPERLEQFRKAS